MRKVCLLCQRTAPDDNLLCQESYCQAERSPWLLDAGEWLGDLEIIRLIGVLRTAALYEARQNERTLLLKVAHPGAAHTERLKREAELLRSFAGERTAPTGLPRLLPPYTNSTLDKHVYGRAALQSQLLYFCLFEHFDGAPLNDLLIGRPQLWVYEVGWLTGELAAAMATLQSRGLYHYGLCPEAVLARFDARTRAPTLLLWDLGVSANRAQLGAAWYPALVPPAYTAPELIGQAQPAASYPTDVYGLGLILYELLNGAPAFPHRLVGDAVVYAAVANSGPLRSGRDEDVQGVAELCEHALSHEPGQRPQSAAEFAAALHRLFGPPPAPRPRRWPIWQ